MKLTREIRCWAHETESGRSFSNTWAGASGGDECDSFWTLRAVVEGDIDSSTGYVCDIRVIDEWLCGAIVDAIRERLRTAERRPSMAACLAEVHGVPLETMAEVTTANAYRFYQLFRED